MTPGKHGTSGHPVPNPEAIVLIASSRLVVCLSAAAAVLRTRYANAPYPMTEMHILKDKTVNSAYRMNFGTNSTQIVKLVYLINSMHTD